MSGGGEGHIRYGVLWNKEMLTLVSILLLIHSTYSWLPRKNCMQKHNPSSVISKDSNSQPVRSVYLSPISAQNNYLINSVPYFSTSPTSSLLQPSAWAVSPPCVNNFTAILLCVRRIYTLWLGA